MKKLLLITLFAAVATGAVAKTDKKQNVLDLKTSITDNAIVYPESFEDDTRKIQENWFVKNYTATDNRYQTEPDVNVSDKEMTRRLAALPTIIEMPYNQIVRNYIDRYTKNGRGQVANLLGLSLYYMPIFEQALEEQGMPLELKYLPVIESALNPNAVSKHGATGLWQFMLGTAKGLGLEVNSLVDERRDPYVSSERAVAYLKDLYNAYGDWSLAIAAYNCGPGTVNKAIRRAGGDPKSHDFWSIYSYLPAETRGYVPLFIAANYVMNYYQKHNISPVLPVKPLVMDTLHISERIHFNQISKVLDIPVEELRILNPQFRADVIPGSVDSPYTLILPSQQIHAYLMSENDIRNYEAEKYSRREVVEPGDAVADAIVAVEETQIWPEESDADLTSKTGKTAKSLIIHKVEPGETLNGIASKYGVTPAEVRRANNLRRNAVRVGQQLRITTDNPQALMESTVATVTGKSQPSRPVAAPKENAKPAVKSTQRQTKEAEPKTGRQQSKQTQKEQPKNQKAQKEQTKNQKNQKSQKEQSKNQKKEAAPSKSNHTLKNGETLTSLSKKYGVSIEEIKKANGMKDDKLRAGDDIKIPSKGKAKGNDKKASSSKSKNDKKASSKGDSKKKKR